MNAYYNSLIHELRILVSEQNYQSAIELIKPELEMPYIQADVQSELETIYSECVANTITPKGHSIEELDKFIDGTGVQKEIAVTLLAQTNLRQHTSRIQKLLESDLLDEFKGELIEAMMEQKLDTPFHIHKEGMDITFIPAAIVPADQDPVLIKTVSLFEQWFSADDPGLETFCHHLLRQEVLNCRPYDFTEYVPAALAKSVVRLVYEAMGMSDMLEAFYEKNGLTDVPLMTLTIEKKGAIKK